VERTGVSAMLARDVAAGQHSMTQEEAVEHRRRIKNPDPDDKGTADGSRHEETAVPAVTMPQVKLQPNTTSELTASSNSSLGSSSSSSSTHTTGSKAWREEAAALLASVRHNVDNTWASSAPQWLQEMFRKLHGVHFIAAGLVFIGLAALVGRMMGILITTILACCYPYRCAKASQATTKHGPFEWRFWSSNHKDPELERTNLMLLMPVMWGQVNSVR